MSTQQGPQDLDELEAAARSAFQTSCETTKVDWLNLMDTVVWTPNRDFIEGAESDLQAV